ncbi:MAG: hypothetical protein IAE82_21440 [Opitutaceae bacterium]|nr:hypothetical protein [Opitutaceae bacterium]
MIAFVLAALWLPAVVHCGIEMLGEESPEARCCSHESDGAVASTGACVADHCGIFDDGHFRTECGSVDVAMPGLGAIFVIAWQNSLAVNAGVEAKQVLPRPPPESACAGQWMFVRRAAPLANAPGRIAA